MSAEAVITDSLSLETPKKKTARKRPAPGTAKKPAGKVSARKAKSAPESTSNWPAAVEAADSKQAKDIRVLDLRDVTGFTQFLVVCSGTNPRQVQAISDEVEKQLKEAGERAISIEGYTHGEWILMDYGDFVVNVFSEKSRTYYDLERLWRDAKQAYPPAA